MDESVKENLKSPACVKKFSKIQFADEMAGNSSHKLGTLISKDFLLFNGEKMVEAVVKVTSKGQLTLPADIRDELNIGKDDYLYVTEAGGLILMKRIGVDPKEILNAFQRAAKEIGFTRKELDRVVQDIRRAKR
jgi:AbrB family looped-hinge helix DNA binding protein